MMRVYERWIGGTGAVPLVLLHGLLGSSRNWLATGKELAAERLVYALDLPNHGEAPHGPEMEYPFLQQSLVEWADQRQIDAAIWLGHSMGGKVAMALACQNPDRVRGLIVVDIAPRQNPHSHENELQAMAALDLSALGSRQQADSALEQLGVKEWAMRQFLLTNLVRTAEGFAWRVNLPVLQRQLPQLAATPLDAADRYDGPTLFIRGDRSPFIRDEDSALIQHHFPAAEIVRLPDSGHNPHIEDRANLNRILQQWCARFAKMT